MSASLSPLRSSSPSVSRPLLGPSSRWRLPLVSAALRRCFPLRFLGQLLLCFAGVPTLPSRVVLCSRRSLPSQRLCCCLLFCFLIFCACSILLRVAAGHGLVPDVPFDNGAWLGFTRKQYPSLSANLEQLLWHAACCGSIARCASPAPTRRCCMPLSALCPVFLSESGCGLSSFVQFLFRLGLASFQAVLSCTAPVLRTGQPGLRCLRSAFAVWGFPDTAGCGLRARQLRLSVVSFPARFRPRLVTPEQA